MTKVFAKYFLHEKIRVNCIVLHKKIYKKKFLAILISLRLNSLYFVVFI